MEIQSFFAWKSCQTRDSAKTLLLMLIDVVVLAFIWIILAPGGPVVQEDNSEPFTPLRLRHVERLPHERLRSHGQTGNDRIRECR